MNKKALFIFFIALVGFFGVYLFFPKNRKDIDSQKIEGEDKEALELIAPPIEKSTGNFILYDTSSGAGLEAVKVQERNITRDSGLMQDIRAKEKIGINLFSNVSGKPANLYRKNILRQLKGSDDTDITLIPETVNDDFIRRLKAISKFALSFEQHKNAQGKTEALKELISMGDFNDIAGYSLFYDYDSLLDGVICNDDGYGNCKFPKKKKRESEHWEDFVKDVPIICENFITATNKVEKSIRYYAIEMLRSNGWKFKGIDQPH